eukprot:1459819-Rhodomonas_salina.1
MSQRAQWKDHRTSICSAPMAPKLALWSLITSFPCAPSLGRKEEEAEGERRAARREGEKPRKEGGVRSVWLVSGVRRWGGVAWGSSRSTCQDWPREDETAV